MKVRSAIPLWIAQFAMHKGTALQGLP